MFMEVMGKYPPPMAEVLADDTPGETKTCVDLGCGSGSWFVFLSVNVLSILTTNSRLGYSMPRATFHMSLR